MQHIHTNDLQQAAALGEQRARARRSRGKALATQALGVLTIAALVVALALYVPGTSKVQVNPDNAKSEAKDVQGNAAATGAAVAASALNEGLNGLKQATVVTWTFDNLAGFYIEGQPAEIGDSIIQAWVKPDGRLWDRGKTYEK